MESTVSRLISTLGATSVEEAGRDTRFAIHGSEGAVLKLSIDPPEQRCMGTLADGNGVTRCTFDVAPIGLVTEDTDNPGRVTMQIGGLRIHIDSKPTLAIEIVSV